MTIVCIEDLRRLARRRIPRMFYDYIDSGAWTGTTYRANETDLAKIGFLQRVGIDVSGRSLGGTMLGTEVSMPVAIAPTGLAGMMHPDGERLAARAAEAAGIPYTLSTMSICSIEEVAEVTRKPFWFQLYMMRDRDFIRRLVARAQAAGCGALLITMDVPVLGQRHKDVRNGLSAPPRLTLANALDMATKPGWCLGMLGTRRRGFGNVLGHVAGVDDTSSLVDWTQKQFDCALTWEDVRWLRSLWQGPLVVKGVLDSRDAEAAVDAGCDAIIVSNHGGRQLDGAPSAISALPGIVKAVGNRVEVQFDSGIRSGQDVLKALALGATGVYLGRAHLYGLAAMGQAGVELALEIIRRELDLSLALCGRTSPADVAEPSILTASHPQ